MAREHEDEFAEPQPSRLCPAKDRDRNNFPTWPLPIPLPPKPAEPEKVKLVKSKCESQKSTLPPLLTLAFRLLHFDFCINYFDFSDANFCAPCAEVTVSESKEGLDSDTNTSAHGA